MLLREQRSRVYLYITDVFQSDVVPERYGQSIPGQMRKIGRIAVYPSYASTCPHYIICKYGAELAAGVRQQYAVACVVAAEDIDHCGIGHDCDIVSSTDLRQELVCYLTAGDIVVVEYPVRRVSAFSGK